MPEQLTTMLQETWAEIDGMAQRHRESLLRSEARERAKYVAEQIRMLRLALDQLHEASRQMDDGAGERVWHTTISQLRAAAPACLADPTNAVVDGGLDLLRLVSYTAASTAIARERRDGILRVYESRDGLVPNS